MIKKDLRALLPLWAACIATMIGGRLAGGEYLDLSIVAYLLGSAAIGAWSIGHEYTHRTLGTLLTLPVPRWRIWLWKLEVTAPLLLSLNMLALVIFPRSPDLRFGAATYYLPTLAGLFIAPWLTIVGRGAVAGAVFTNSIAAILFLAGGWIGVQRYGYTRVADVFQASFLSWTLTALSVFAAVHGWRLFSRLQVLDAFNTGVHLRLPRAATADHARIVARHPLGALIRKELRLHQLAWLVAAMYVVLYVVIVVTRRSQHDADNFATLLSVIHGMVQALLIGGLASAEERHFGTHDGQLLLPVSSTRQWLVKVGAAILHTEVLAIGLPLLMVFLLPVEGVRAFGRRPVMPGEVLLIIAAVTSLSLYVSTLMSSGLRALIVSVPVALASAIFMQRLSQQVSSRVYHLLWIGKSRPIVYRPPVMAAETFLSVVTVAIAALIVWRALPHYRWNDRRALRIAGDAVFVFAALLASFALAGVLRV